MIKEEITLKKVVGFTKSNDVRFQVFFCIS
jgi:hypothetical protein